GTVVNRARVSGTFALDPEVWSLGQAIVLNGKTMVAEGMTNVQVFWMDDGMKFLLPLGNMVRYTFMGNRLSLLPSGVVLRFERFNFANQQSLVLAGSADLPANAAAIAKPRVALAFLLRHVEGRNDDFIVPPNGAGDMNDKPL